jgi:Flp pilus assembly protein TadD
MQQNKPTYAKPQARSHKNPYHDHPIFKKAVAFFEAGDYQSAYTLFALLIHEDPKNYSAWLNAGTALRKLKKFDASYVCTKRAIALEPDNAGAYTNLGNCLIDLDRMDDAIKAHEKAVALKPADLSLVNNYALALREAGLFEKAYQQFQMILNHQPHNMSIKWDQALTSLYMADYQKGWEAFETRWHVQGMKLRHYDHAPLWRGEDLTHKTILIHEEQGFGDSILCSRYLPLLAVRGAKIILECKKPLHDLFSTLSGVIEICEAYKAQNTFDYHLPMMSLPGAFKTDLTNIPPPPALNSAKTLPTKAQDALNRGDGFFKVGIVWSGSVTFANNRKRAVALDRFLRFAEIPNVQLYSLQKGPCEPELKAAHADAFIYELAPHCNSFAETAAALQQLDLVIMTDSSIAHLAGSLNVPIWNLLNYRPYWLYLSDRADCPWYPAMRLFRQPKAGDWDSVFADVHHALAQTVDAHRRKK